MVALIKGKKAPPLELAGIDGKRYNLQLAASSTNGVVLAFFKVSCPVCQYALPFIERLYQRYPGLNIWGVSQDDIPSTSAFVAQYGLSFPILLDHDLKSTVDYDLTNVPTVFLIDKNLSITQTTVGFVRDELEQLNSELARQVGRTASHLFFEADNVPDLRPG